MRVFGVFLTCFGLLITLGVLVSIGKERPGTLAGDIFGLIAMGIAPTIGGIWLVRREILAKREEEHEALERTILMLAREKKGKLTPSEVALKTQLSLEEAREHLLRMQERGFAVLHTSERGAIVFEFHEFLSEGERGNSQSVL